jgi:predicted RNA-binding Zn-ribbon protein involved in translation (DUF1610 family)
MKKPESKWILEDEDMATWKCPQCGWVLYLVSMTPIENKYHYCPNCGVNLIEEERSCANCGCEKYCVDTTRVCSPICWQPKK